MKKGDGMSDKLIILWHNEAFLCDSVTILGPHKEYPEFIEIVVNSSEGSFKTNTGEVKIMPAEAFKMNK